MGSVQNDYKNLVSLLGRMIQAYELGALSGLRIIEISQTESEILRPGLICKLCVEADTLTATFARRLYRFRAKTDGERVIWVTDDFMESSSMIVTDLAALIFELLITSQ